MFMFCEIVIGVDCAIWIVCAEANKGVAKPMFAVTPVSALAASTASRRLQLELLPVMPVATQCAALSFAAIGSVATVTTYAGATNRSEPLSVPLAPPPSVMLMGAVSPAVSVMVTVMTLPLTLGVPKAAVVLEELKLAVAPGMALPPASFSVTVTCAELPATAGLGETTTVEFTVDAATDGMAVPFSVMDCVAMVFRTLSVMTSDSVSAPLEGATGVKVSGKLQVAPTARMPGLEAELVTDGQAALLVVVKVKSFTVVGLVPAAGISKYSGWLPMFCTVTVWVPSAESVLPSYVLVGKATVGGVARAISFTALLM